eukprot:13142601-Alexandrium_andersonii.AAC.1
MSASLVGSEMCIRDSPSTLRSIPKIETLWNQQPRMRDSIDNLRALSVRPVSYTHLTLPTICSV